MSQSPDDEPTADFHDGAADRSPMVRQDRGPLERPGDEIGPYRLISQLGEGGFGTVWLAERRHPFAQRVALKIVKAGMDSKSVLARFEQERQALAVMNHPNIAKVIDGGLTPAGRPYFAMEYVKGDPITDFCDARRLGVRERLGLFAQACDAVQHAHVKGLVHRDLKPSNVLAFEADGKFSLKVIDFGVAKALTQRMSEHTIFTETGQMIGTPEYMSPEQADPTASDIDTRSDIYSLGVLLYELVTGALPFEPRELRSKAYGEIQRVIREVDPPTPSARLSTLATKDADSAGRIEKTRGMELRDLAKQLKSELEWIPLKAMRKEPQHRYQSAMSFADDVRAYLDGRPIMAAPESVGYRLRKYARRNRALVAGACAVAAALVVGLGLATWQWRAAVASEQRALAAKAAADAAREQAEAERAKAEDSRRAESARAAELQQVSDFQSRMLGQIDTTRAGLGLMADVRERFVAALEKAGVPAAERTQRADSLRDELLRVNATDAAAAMIDRTILRPALKTVDAEFGKLPKVDAQLRQALADVYVAVGLYDAAMPLQESALATRRRVLGEEHRDTLLSTTRMGGLLLNMGDLAAVEPYYSAALEKSRRVLGEEHPDTLGAIRDMGVLMIARGKLEEAEPFIRDAMEKMRRVLGVDHPDALRATEGMGVLLINEGKFAEAEPYLRDALERTRRVLGEDHAELLGALTNMGVVLVNQAKPAEAEPYFRESLEKSRRVLGEEHPAVLRSIGNMGVLLASQGKLEAAEPYFRESVEKRRRVLGAGHPDTLRSIMNLTAMLANQGKSAEAEDCMRATLEQARRTLGEAHPDVLKLVSNMGALLQNEDKLAEAEVYYREAWEKGLRGLGVFSVATVRSVLADLVDVLFAERKQQELIELLAPAEPAVRSACTGKAASALGDLLVALGRARASVGSDADRFRLAEGNLVEAHEIFVKAGAEEDERAAMCAKAIVELYRAWNAAEPGKGHDAQADAWRARAKERGEGRG